MENQNLCPVCNSSLVQEASRELRTSGDKYPFNCSRCGEFILTGSVNSWLSTTLKGGDERISLLSHSIRKMQGKKDIPILDSYLVEKILKSNLPTLADQANNLILWFGDTYDPGKKAHCPPEFLQSIIGAKTREGANLVKNHVKEIQIFEVKSVGGGYSLSLTMKGWQAYEKIKSGAIMSRKAFMAMKYGDKDLDWIFENCFRPAVKATGFTLYRLDENPRAGLIDDRLRNEIRTSRFLLSDLTHENAGAYWEAGFAEGLSKPVIYTCEKRKFENDKTHFDTNHHLTVIWEKENPEVAIEQLKATIRATLPDEAILIDE